MNAHNEQQDPESAVVKQNLTTQPAAAQESAPWRDHDAAIDAKALSTATEIALMWGQDRSQFISRIQVAVIDAMRWVKGGLQPAAAQEAGTVEIVGRTYLVRDVTAALAKAGYAAPVTAAPADNLHAHLLHMLEDAGRITGELHAAASTPAAPGIDLAALRARVVSAIERITSGTGQMRVPADLTDPDLVLADVLTLLDALDPHCTDSPKGGSEARDAARLDWLDANGFTAYRQIDQIDGLSSHCVVVHEMQRPRRGNVHDTIRGAIDAAMQEQANSHGAGVES